MRSLPVFTRHIGAALSVVLVCILGPVATAATFNWNNFSGGNFGAASNWTPSGGPPDAAFDTAVFDLLGVYTVDIGTVTNSRFEVTTGDVTFDLFRPENPPIPALASTYSLVGTLGPAADISSHPGALFPVTLTLVGGQEPFFGPRSTVDADGFLRIGRDANSNGSLVLQGVIWDSSATTTVGLNGLGDLRIDSDSVMSNTSAIVGLASGAVGDVIVEGKWFNTGTLSVGVLGQGTLEIAGEVSNDGDSGIAVTAGTSSVTVNSGTWTNGGSLFVGGGIESAGGTGSLEMNGATSQVTVTSALRIWPGSTVTMNDGTLDTGALVGAGTMNWTKGAVNVTGSDFTVDSVSPLGGAETLDADKPLTVSGALKLAQGGPATVSIIGGGQVMSSAGVLGNESASDGPASLLVAGAGSTWNISGDLQVGGRNTAAFQVSTGGAVNNVNASVATDPLSSANIILTQSGARWASTGSVYLGGDASAAGGTGTTEVRTGGTLDVGSTLKVWDDYVLQINGGSVDAPVLDVRGRVDVTGTLDLTGAGTIATLVLEGGTINADRVDFGDNDLTGFGAINGKVSIGGDVIATGDLTLGDAAGRRQAEF
ncbi:MAG: hypothetical protein CMJ18_04780 [Phycisphaeraceae bacterium]|nr:hypothetical protein [Phycisphaeraceae bacterium]